MKKYLWIGIIVSMVAIANKVNAQYFYDGDRRIIKGYDPALSDITGSPFLYEQWNPGSVIAASGKVQANLRLKYDVLDDIPLFAGIENDLLGFPEDIKSFTINSRVFTKGFPAVDTLSGRNYYQVLTAGKAVLLKHFTKSIVKTTSYGSAVPKLRFDDKEAWYLFIDGKMVAVKPNSKNIADALTDKKEQVQAFIQNNKIKTDTDLAMLVTYYNNLP